MSARWIEKASDDASSLSIAVDAIDLAESERKEIASFKRALDTPAKQPDALFVDGSGQKWSSISVLHGTIAIASFLFAAVFLAFASRIANIIELAPSPLEWLAVYLTALLAPIAILAFRYRKRSTDATKVRARFTITLDAAGLTLASPTATKTYALDTFDHIEGGRTIVLTARDGHRETLGLSLDTAAENADLASRIDEALVQTRASAGYRGGGVRIAIDAPDDDGDADDDTRAKSQAPRPR